MAIGRSAIRFDITLARHFRLTGEALSHEGGWSIVDVRIQPLELDAKLFLERLRNTRFDPDIVQDHRIEERGLTVPTIGVRLTCRCTTGSRTSQVMGLINSIIDALDPSQTQ